MCIAAGAAIIGGISVAKAKADHDAEIAQKQSHKQPHELSTEELRAKCPPQREHYEGNPSRVGKDVEASLGMRVRLGEGHISQGVGTIVEIFEEGDQVGTCAVIWDSDECHTRPLHQQLGNRHICRIGKCSDFDLVLAEASTCPDFEIREHVYVHNGTTRKHLEVIRKCMLKRPSEPDPVREPGPDESHAPAPS